MLVPVPGAVLVAVIDGAGHGPPAAHAARCAATVFERLATSGATDVEGVLAQCHVALKGTRGAAISLARLSCSQSTMTWVGLGNVEGRLCASRYTGFRRDASLRLFSGAAGHDMPPVTAATLPLRRGDLVAFASDGVAREFADRLDTTRAPAELAERILDDYWDDNDDAVVVVVRWLGARTGAAS